MLVGLEPITRGDAAATFSAQHLTRWGRAIEGDLETTSAGTPAGDLAMLFDASVARDTLAATGLASWLLRRLERGWPDSPYLAKALLIRMALEPDSADALRARLGQRTDSPYLAHLRGEEGARFAVLEDSLSFYFDDRMAAVIAGSAGDAN